MLQSYTLLHKTSGNENISVLNFIKSNNLKVLLPNSCYYIIFFVTETLHFQIIFVSLRHKSKH